MNCSKTRSAPVAGLVIDKKKFHPLSCLYFRTMLDRWNMFAERSELDITLTNKDPSWDNMVQIYVACNFCGKSISNSGRNRMNKTGSLTRQTTGQQNKNKAQVMYVLDSDLVNLTYQI